MSTLTRRTVSAKLSAVWHSYGAEYNAISQRILNLADPVRRVSVDTYSPKAILYAQMGCMNIPSTHIPTRLHKRELEMIKIWITTQDGGGGGGLPPEDVKTTDVRKDGCVDGVFL